MPASQSSEPPYLARVCSAEVNFIPRRLASPLQLSTGTIEALTETQVSVTVEADGGRRRGVGRGSMYLSDLWAWPDPALSHDRRDQVLREVCQRVAKELPSLALNEPLHPLELGLRLHRWVCDDLRVDEDPTALARAMCASPFDAAIHDGVGQALTCSAFRFYDEPASLPSADPYFDGCTACEAIAATLQQPRTVLPAWLVVGKNDSLNDAVAKAVKTRGYRCFKLKITGRDPKSDAARTADVFRAVTELGVKAPRLTVDSNEGNPDLDSVIEYLNRLKSDNLDAYQSLEYLEQPTGRDISEHVFDWRKVTASKPVLLDEGMKSLKTLEQARRQGWSGLALKTCKGHSMVMAAAAWAHSRDMVISLQDLTNPGLSLIHAALVGAHLPTLNGVELNSPQFTPSANGDFLPRLSDLFEPHQGVHELRDPNPVGLGSML